MTDVLALGLLVVAVPGLLLDRFGPMGVRLLTLLALTALFLAVLDFERVVEEKVPPRIALVGTAEPVPPELGRRIESAGAEVEVVSDPVAGRSTTRASETVAYRERLARGALRAGPRARELLLVWSGPLPVEEPVLSGHGLTAVVPEQTLDLDPQQLQVWLVGAMQVDRPAALQVRLADAHRAVQAEVVVGDPGGVDILVQQLDLDRDAPVVELAVIPKRPGEHTLRLSTTIDGITLERRGWFAVAGPDPVMVVGEDAEQLARALSVQGMAALHGPSLPDDLSNLSALVLLEPTSPDEQERLQTWLEAGGGLFVVGGQPGALPERGELLHELLPVVVLPREPASPEPVDEGGAEGGGETPPEQENETATEDPPTPPTPPAGEVRETELDPVEEEVDRRLVGMVLVVDRSMSMGDRVEGGLLIKMDYAKRSAMATAEALQDGDELGLVTFGNKGYGRTELPMTAVTDLRQVRDRISRLSHARESTYLTSGLERAGDLLGRSAAAVRFIVVITDGVFQDQELLVTRTARRLAANGINVSLIQIVGDTSEGGALKSKKVTDAGQGTYMRTQSAAQVPRLVVAEVGRALGRAGREPAELPDPDATGSDPEETPPPEAKPAEPPPDEVPTPEPPEPDAASRIAVRAVTDSVLLEPRLPAGFPDLGGMDPVLGRPDAHVLLVGGEQGLPVLAFANRGLGRIAVWASDFVGPWGQAWREAPEFPGRLALWVQSLFPPAEGVPGDVLTSSALQPLVPTARELDHLAEISTGPLLRAGEFEVPGPRTVLSAMGMAQELAIAAALALLVLAVGEYLLLRWKARWS